MGDSVTDGLEIPGALQLENRDNGLTLALIDTPQAEAELYLHGAHLTSWIPAGARPVLFTSSRSFFARGKPIRGGVPIVFPWFGPRGGGLPGPMHGFHARTMRVEARAHAPPRRWRSRNPPYPAAG